MGICASKKSSIDVVDVASTVANMAGTVAIAGVIANASNFGEKRRQGVVLDDAIPSFGDIIKRTVDNIGAEVSKTVDESISNITVEISKAVDETLQTSNSLAIGVDSKVDDVKEVEKDVEKVVEEAKVEIAKVKVVKVRTIPRVRLNKLMVEREVIKSKIARHPHSPKSQKILEDRLVGADKALVNAHAQLANAGLNLNKILAEKLTVDRKLVKHRLTKEQRDVLIKRQDGINTTLKEIGYTE